jgi:serine phosphatase RsbU (regulator of sigma subunit)
LAQANVALHGSIDQRWFATMTCAQIFDAQRTLRIGRAGHCPTLLVRNGVASYSRPQGLGLAIAKPILFDRNLEIEEIGFSSGDYAIFFSDGLTEARSPDGEEYGYDALLATAMGAASANATPRAMRDAIFESIDRFSKGVPPMDDSTLVILRWK